MTRGLRGQSLVELALCAPIVLLLTLGTAAAAQVADASAGLDAATQAAAAAAARAPDAATAQNDAKLRFESMIAGYPLSSAVIRLTFGDFSRSDQVVVSASGSVDIEWAAFFLPRSVALKAVVTVDLERWRTHRVTP